MGWSGMPADMGWAWLFSALVVAGLVLLVVVLVRIVRGGLTRDGRPSPPPGDSPPAEALLAQRYARGEIDTEEYEERLRHLRGA